MKENWIIKLNTGDFVPPAQSSFRTARIVCAVNGDGIVYHVKFPWIKFRIKENYYKRFVPFLDF